ncbi:MAG: matrixin family metalloprotease [Chloroflexi bacterium]|nr:matrixin family metalloprotease [Chloroflexota bacterium]
MNPHRIFFLISLLVLMTVTGVIIFGAAGAPAEAQDTALPVFPSACSDEAYVAAQNAYLDGLSPEGPGANSPESEAVRQVFANRVLDCLAQIDAAPRTIDDGPLIPPPPPPRDSGEIGPNYALQGHKWGARPSFSAESSPQLAGGTVYYSYMPNGVPNIVETTNATNTAINSLWTYQSCFLDEIANAFAAWQSVSNIQFVHIADAGVGAPSGSPAGYQGHIRIGAHEMDGSLFLGGGTLAHADFPLPGSTIGGDLHFDHSENWQCTIPFICPLCVDIGVVALHEIGHSIGLLHETINPAVMNPFYNPEFTFPLSDDINGMYAIYGGVGTPGVNISDFLSGPNPAMRVVSGLETSITDVNVTLSGLYHTWPEDMDILLVSPAGQKVILMSDACGGFDLWNVSLTFDQSAASAINDTICGSGSYRPADYEPGETLPCPAPAGPYSTTLSTFDGANPNGTWSLWVCDDSVAEAGGLLSWSLSITASAPATDTPTPTLTPTATNTATSTPTPSSSPTNTPTPTATATATRVYLVGDINKDGFVNIADFSLLAAAFGTAVGQPGFNPDADLNNDNVVNISDFSLLAANFGQSS